MNFLERIRSDVIYAVGLYRLIKVTSAVKPDDEAPIGSFIEDCVDQFGERIFIDFEGQTQTFAAFDARANQFAHWGLSIGLKPGDSVALFMENTPDYIAFWAGMTKIAVRTALINYNLTGAGLAHCVTIVGCRALVMSASLGPAYESARRDMTLELGAWALGAGDGLPGVAALDEIVRQQSAARPDRSHRAGIKASAVALYIYTSGTTGLPKAARITNLRARGLMSVFVPATGVTRRDRILLTLPLYHATGGMCGVGCALTTGATLLLKRRFSASHFWQEAIDDRATMFVYIGELGRYLMNQPPSSLERSHRVVKCFGNGLRADVWDQLVERTGIRRIVEFYGSTEGNVNYFNLDGRIGAIGRVPEFLRSRIRGRLLKFDVELEEPVRGPDGFCIEAGPDEPGEAVGPINDEPRQRFDGYNDETQSRKKILRDVFATGDAWFRTGDLLRRDRDGYIYFVDRVGDTYRWKSENVSTGEVESALAAVPGVTHAVVYGVSVPGYEGRAGMAAISIAGDLDLAAIQAHLAQRLAAFARPVFLRLQQQAETTGTFKYRKVDLVKAGFDPMAVDDPLFVMDAAAGGYRPIDAQTHRDIVSGYLRL